MAELETTTRTGNVTTTSKWWVGLLTPQTVVYILAAFASLVVFWNTQKNHSQHLDVIDKEISSKADDADLKALSERVNRQYDINNKLQDRIVSLEKELEYNRGLHEGIKENSSKYK